jgi:lysophospholipid acyltransferase (LPLAT)-like uncharacterized protein
MKKLTQVLAPYLLFFVYRLLRFTWRVRVTESEGLKKLLAENKIFVAAHWHGEELGLLYLLKRYHVGCMVSLSSDGELMAKVIHLLGSRTVRGSSSRGGVGALRGIITLSKSGWRPSVAVDGPKGPRHQVKPGVIEIAKILKVPILSISMASSRPFIFKKSWNQSELPLPFSKIHVTWGEPIEITDPENAIAVTTPLIASSLHRGRELSLAQL